MISPRTFSAENKRLVLMIVALVAVLIIGTAGYELIEGWRFLDALYMTVITMTTVGYLEVHPMSDAGRVFTMLVLAMGLGVAFLILTTITQLLIERQLGWLSGSWRMRRMIDKLTQHTIFCGYGQLSNIAIKELIANNVKPVVIEIDPIKAQHAREAGLYVVEGDATTDGVLKSAGIERARFLAALLHNDADNLYTILLARELNPALFIVTRAENEQGEMRLKRAGANRIVAPLRVGGQKVADGMLRPYVTDFLDLAVSSTSKDLEIREIKIPVQSKITGKTLAEAALRDKHNILVVAMIGLDGQMQFNPTSNVQLIGESTIIALGFKKDFLEMERNLVAV